MPTKWYRREKRGFRTIVLERIILSHLAKRQHMLEEKISGSVFAAVCLWVLEGLPKAPRVCDRSLLSVVGESLIAYRGIGIVCCCWGFSEKLIFSVMKSQENSFATVYFRNFHIEYPI